MEIKSAQVNNFISSSLEKYNGVLLYGPEVGLVSNRAKTIATKIIGDLKDPFRYADIDFTKILESPFILSDELSSLSLTGGKRVIRIRDVKPSIPKNIVEIIKQYSSKDSFLLMTSGELAKSSYTRLFFEKESTLAALPCYADNESSVRQIIISSLNKENIKYDPEILPMLLDLFAENRMVILSELDKLITYAKDKDKLTKEDVFKAVQSSKEASIENICIATANKDLKLAENCLSKAISENVEPIAIIRSIIYYFNRLYSAQKSIASGKSTQQAMSSLRPPVFFKNIDSFKKHLNIWNQSSILKVLTLLTSAEIKCKTVNIPSILICKRIILSLSSRK